MNLDKHTHFELHMKTSILITAIFLISLQPFASAADGQIFSSKERQNILKVIDSICADTWCEGDYNFKFLDLSCLKKTRRCDVSFQFIKTEDEDHQVKSPVQTCSIGNITGIKSVLLSEDSLNNDFYEELSECILSKEQSVIF